MIFVGIFFWWVKHFMAERIHSVIKLALQEPAYFKKSGRKASSPLCTVFLKEMSRKAKTKMISNLWC